MTALVFNAVWQYVCRRRLLHETLDSAGAKAISRRFQLALARSPPAPWLVSGLPVIGLAVIAAFNAFTGFRFEARVPTGLCEAEAAAAERCLFDEHCGANPRGAPTRPFPAGRAPAPPGRAH